MLNNHQFNGFLSDVIESHLTISRSDNATHHILQHKNNSGMSNAILFQMIVDEQFRQEVIKSNTRLNTEFKCLKTHPGVSTYSDASQLCFHDIRDSVDNTKIIEELKEIMAMPNNDVSVLQYYRSHQQEFAKEDNAKKLANILWDIYDIAYHDRWNYHLDISTLRTTIEQHPNYNILRLEENSFYYKNFKDFLEKREAYERNLKEYSSYLKSNQPKLTPQQDAMMSDLSKFFNCTVLHDGYIKLTPKRILAYLEAIKEVQEENEASHSMFKYIILILYRLYKQYSSTQESVYNTNQDGEDESFYHTKDYYKRHAKTFINDYGAEKAENFRGFLSELQLKQSTNTIY